MKKTLTLLLLLLVLPLCLTGCGKSSSKSESKENGSKSESGVLECSKSEKNDDGYTTNETVTIKYKDNKVISVQNVSIEEMDPDSVDFVVGFSALFAEALNQVEGISASYEKTNNTTVKSTVTVDYTKLDTKALEEALGDSSDESSMYVPEDLDLDAFKKANLEGYTCK